MQANICYMFDFPAFHGNCYIGDRGLSDPNAQEEPSSKIARQAQQRAKQAKARKERKVKELKCN